MTGGYESVDPRWQWLKRRRENGVYYIVRKRDGVVKRESLKTRDEAEAIARYSARFGATAAANPNTTCAKAWTEFIASPGREGSTKARYATAWKYADEILGGMKPNDVRSEDILRVYEQALAQGGFQGSIRKNGVRQGPPLSDSSMKKIEVALSAFFTACTEVGLNCRDAGSNPVTLCRKALTELLDERGADEHEGMLEDDEIEEVDQVLTVEEQALLAAAAGTPKMHAKGHHNSRERDSILIARQLRALVELGPGIGWRIGEALGAKVSDWKPLAKTPYIQVVRQRRSDGKANDPRTWTKGLKGAGTKQGDKKRPVPLRPETAKILQDYINEGIAGGWLQPDGLLFPTWKGTPRTTTYMGTQIREAAERAGITRRVVSHFFRHTYASREYARGVETKWIAKRMGDTIKVVESTYLHIWDEDDFGDIELAE